MPLNNEQPVLQVDLDYIRTAVVQHVEALLDDVKGMLDIMGRSIEALEKQMGTMSVGYVEQAAIIEALVSVVPLKERETFYAALKKSRDKMMKAMKEGSDALSGDG